MSDFRRLRIFADQMGVLRERFKANIQIDGVNAWIFVLQARPFQSDGRICSLDCVLLKGGPKGFKLGDELIGAYYDAPTDLLKGGMVGLIAKDHPANRLLAAAQHELEQNKGATQP